MQGCFDALFVWIPAIVCASVIERMYDWSPASISRPHSVTIVSVVIERMYDWSLENLEELDLDGTFQLLLKECTIEAAGDKIRPPRCDVSVVIERMYDWSQKRADVKVYCSCFSCYWKNVRLKLRNQLIENKRFLTVGFWSVFRKWSICTKSAIIFENLGWLLDCFW